MHGGVAHDLNSPMMAVKSELYNAKEVMKDETISVEEKEKELSSSLENIEKSISKMSKTVNSIRDQIRNTADKPKREFNLNQLVETAKTLIGSMLRLNNCTLNIDIPNDIEILGEENKLDRVITNIIKNSIEAYKGLKTDGDIDITARYIIEDEKTFCRIEIKDQAGGISKEILTTLFKEMRTTKEEEGTGMGLYLAYQIITGEFRGEMKVESIEGEGTTIILKIPTG